MTRSATDGCPGTAVFNDEHIETTDKTDTAKTEIKFADAADGTTKKFCAGCMVARVPTPVTVFRPVKVKIIDCNKKIAPKKIAGQPDAIYIHPDIAFSASSTNYVDITESRLDLFTLAEAATCKTEVTCGLFVVDTADECDKAYSTDTDAKLKMTKGSDNQYKLSAFRNNEEGHTEEACFKCGDKRRTIKVV
jgi:hypothetical protein